MALVHTGTHVMEQRVGKVLEFEFYYYTQVSIWCEYHQVGPRKYSTRQNDIISDERLSSFALDYIGWIISSGNTVDTRTYIVCFFIKSTRDFWLFGKNCRGKHGGRNQADRYNSSASLYQHVYQNKLTRNSQFFCNPFPLLCRNCSVAVLLMWRIPNTGSHRNFRNKGVNIHISRAVQVRKGNCQPSPLWPAPARAVASSCSRPVWPHQNLSPRLARASSPPVGAGHT